MCEYLIPVFQYLILMAPPSVCWVYLEDFFPLLGKFTFDEILFAPHISSHQIVSVGSVGFFLNLPTTQLIRYRMWGV